MPPSNGSSSKNIRPHARRLPKMGHAQIIQSRLSIIRRRMQTQATFIQLARHGFWGLALTGGLMLHVGVDPSVGIEEVRDSVAGLQDIGAISVQEFGTEPGEYLLRVPVGDEKVGGGRAALIKNQLRTSFADAGFEEKRTEIVGPRVGKELRRRGILSVIFATLMMGSYIAIRFDLRFGIGAGAALAHDVGALTLQLGHDVRAHVFRKRLDTAARDFALRRGEPRRAASAPHGETP